MSAGFTQVTPYDFQHSGPLSSSYLYEELFRQPFREDDGQLVGYDAWGWGFAGISFFFGTPHDPGWAYMNQTRVDDYFRDLDAGRFPVLRGFHYSEADLRLHLLFQELQSLEVDRRRYLGLVGRDAVEEHRPVWGRAGRAGGGATVDDELITIEGDGAFYLPLIQNALAHDRLAAMRRERRLATAGGGDGRACRACPGSAGRPRELTNGRATSAPSAPRCWPRRTAGEPDLLHHFGSRRPRQPHPVSIALDSRLRVS